MLACAMSHNQTHDRRITCALQKDLHCTNTFENGSYKSIRPGEDVIEIYAKLVSSYSIDSVASASSRAAVGSEQTNQDLALRDGPPPHPPSLHPWSVSHLAALERSMVRRRANAYNYPDLGSPHVGLRSATALFGSMASQKVQASP